jgi:hypothetical protein
MNEDQQKEFLAQLKYQIGVFESRFESERRNRDRLNDRCGMIERTQERIELKLDDILSKWNNGGTAINVKVDRLIQSKEQTRWTFDRIISIASVAAVIIYEVIDHFSK